MRTAESRLVEMLGLVYGVTIIDMITLKVNSSSLFYIRYSADPELPIDIE